VTIDQLSRDVDVRRVRYASPLEVALVVPAAILVTKSALALLLFGVKRVYGYDLELRAHREEQRAAFYDARALAEEAERAWIAERELPALWTPEMVALLRQLALERSEDEDRLEADGAMLVDDDIGT